MSRQGRAYVVEFSPLSVVKARASAENKGSGRGAGDLGLELSPQEENKGLTKG